MKPSLIVGAAASAVVASALALGQEPPPAPPGSTTAKGAAATASGGSEFKDISARLSYFIGFDAASRFKAVGFDVDPAVIAQGAKDAQGGGKSRLSDAEVQETIKAVQQQAMSKQAEMQKVAAAEGQKQGEANRKEGAAYLAANAQKPGVKTLPSGLQYKVNKDGTGPSPKATDVVTAHYEGRLINGKVFDSSHERGQPADFALNEVIKGWTEALQLMKVGSDWEIYIPADLAYGDRPKPGGPIPPGSTLIFKVQLLGINGQK